MLSTGLVLMLLWAAPSESDTLSRAVALREAGQDEAARVLLAETHQRAPSAKLAAQLGLVEAALERWVVAEQHLTEALAAAKDPWVKSNASILSARLEAVRGRLGWLEITAAPDGTEITLGGRRLGTAPLAGPVRVVAGTQTLSFARDGYRTLERTEDVAAGRTERVNVALSAKALVTMDLSTPAERIGSSAPDGPQARERPGRGAVFWLTAAGAVVSIAAGVVGVVAATQSRDATPGAVVGVAGLGVGAALSTVLLVQLLGVDAPPEAPAVPKAPKVPGL